MKFFNGMAITLSLSAAIIVAPLFSSSVMAAEEYDPDAPATEEATVSSPFNAPGKPVSNGSISGDSDSSPEELLIADNLVVGEIRELMGKAMLHKQGEVRGSQAQAGDILKAKDILRTKRNSQAVIQLIDGSTIVLQEKSSLHLKGLLSLSLEEGTVLFDIRKRGKSKGLTVATKTAVIGVKGTQFLVRDVDETIDVFLNEGKVDVTPVAGEFKHYKAVVASSFEEYSQQMNAQFAEKKEEMRKGVEAMKREFVEYLARYDMEPGSAIAISNGELTSYKMPDELDVLFEHLEQEAKETRKKLKAQGELP